MSDPKKTIPTSDTCRSFIPYLQIDHNQGLKIKLAVRPDSDGVQGGPLNFMMSAGPPAVILPAMLSLDGRLSGTEFFMLLQPDDYSSASSELRPLCNPEIEHLWQEALNRSGKSTAPNDTTIPMSVWEETCGWIPFAPILYCCHRDQYCPALCPQCGHKLTLCRDDRALAEAGLQPFSTSAERYLYCTFPQCESAASVFYARRAAANSDVPVHDCGSLVAHYATLLDRADLSATLPCIGCEHHGDCFGPGNLVVSRMVPLVFFPFHAILQPAPALNLLDFIPLLGGRGEGSPSRDTAMESNACRQLCRTRFHEIYDAENGFLFQGDGRHFLEVLYLKLTLLHGLTETAMRTPELFRPAVDRMTLEGFWVHLAKRSGRLPYLWGFDVQLVDIVGWPRQGGSGSGLARSTTHYFLANAWFYVLLNNARQDFGQVRKALSAYLTGGASASQGIRVSDDPFDPFGPGNIFWNGSPCPVDSQYYALWQQSLDLGVSLYRAGLSADPNWSDQEFDVLLTGLRNSVRRALFPAPMGIGVRDPLDTADQQIAAIVGTILRKWPSPDAVPTTGQEPEAGAAAATATPPSEDGDIEETVILGPEDSLPGLDGRSPQGHAGLRAETTHTPVPLPEDDAERTVVISPASKPSDKFDPDQTVIIGGLPPPTHNKVETPAPRLSVPPCEEDPDRTVVMRPAPSAPLRDDDPDQTIVSRPPLSEPPEDLEKTVVISPAASTPVSGQYPEQVPVGRPPVTPPEEDPDRTVVISPPRAPAGEPDLEETVLMGRSAASSREDPDRTVIIERPSHQGAPAEGTVEVKTPAGKAHEHETPPEDDLEATVVMHPGPNKK